MKDYAKVGNRKNQPAYRTPALFRIRKQNLISKAKAGKRGGRRFIPK